MEEDEEEEEYKDNLCNRIPRGNKIRSREKGKERTNGRRRKIQAGNHKSKEDLSKTREGK